MPRLPAALRSNGQTSAKAIGGGVVANAALVFNHYLWQLAFVQQMPMDVAVAFVSLAHFGAGYLIVWLWRANRQTFPPGV